MSKASLPMQNLARQLFVIEAGRADASASEVPSAVRVCEKMRAPLTKVAGPVGYSSLLSRALALATAEDSALAPVHIGQDGILNGFDSVQRSPHALGDECREEAGITVVAHMLELLVIFIGEGLMVNLLSDAWPGESFDSIGLTIKVKS